MEGRSLVSVSLIAFLFPLVSCTCMTALSINHVWASSGFEKCHGSVLGPVSALYSLSTLSLVCHFHSLIFNFCLFLLNSGSLTSRAQTSLLRPDPIQRCPEVCNNLQPVAKAERWPSLCPDFFLWWSFPISINVTCATIPMLKSETWKSTSFLVYKKTY